jgi:hypothetical protein
MRRQKDEKKVEGIGHVSIDTDWTGSTWVTHILVTRFNGDGKLCETRYVAGFETDAPEESHYHWTCDSVLLPFLVEKAKEWPEPIYVPIPVTTIHGDGRVERSVL